MKNFLKIGVDVDDVLYLCNQHAINLLSRERNIEGLDIYDIDSWGTVNSNPVLNQRISYFSDPEFVKSQPLFDGAKDFISKLCKKGEVFFITAVGKNCMNERAERLCRDFPCVAEQNIIIGSRKDLISLDIMLDDGAHNILGSNAKYPVLFRRPWNNNLTGLLAVNSYSDFLLLVDQIAANKEEKHLNFSNGGIICLVGPSGSNKTLLSEFFKEKNKRFVRPLTTTTRLQRKNEKKLYFYENKKDFEKKIQEGKFLEYTVYGGNYYGCSVQTVQSVLEEKKIAVMPVDICGAIALKNCFSSCCVIVFTDCSRRAILKSIINMDSPEDEKILRILSIDSEFKNKEICDCVVNMDNGCEQAYSRIINVFQISL